MPKSKQIDVAVQSFLDAGVAVINGDDYRMSHPQKDKILELDDKKFAEMTDPDVRIWTKRLFDTAIKNRRNIIFEGTMRSKEPLLTTIKRLKEEGYRVDIVVVAVKKEFSRLGTLMRYENQKTAFGYGRWTPLESTTTKAVSCLQSASPWKNTACL